MLDGDNQHKSPFPCVDASPASVAGSAPLSCALARGRYGGRAGDLAPASRKLPAKPAGAPLIYVIATLQLRPQARDLVLREIAAVSTEVRREDGCLEYQAAIDVESGHARQTPLRPDVVTVIERWRDLAALQAHSGAPHMRAFRQRIGEAVVSTTLQVLSPAAASPIPESTDSSPRTRHRSCASSPVGSARPGTISGTLDEQ